LSFFPSRLPVRNFDLGLDFGPHVSWQALADDVLLRQRVGFFWFRRLFENLSQVFEHVTLGDFPFTAGSKKLCGRSVAAGR
jgi:hypothetical protein